MVVHRKPGSQLLSALGILVTAGAVGFGVVAATGIGPSYSELRARASSQNAVPACPPLVFFGVRGSGETAKDYYGYGQIISSMRNYLQDLVPGMGSEPVNYPAIAVRWPDPRYKVAYGNSVSHGVANVMAIYATLRSWCPRTPLVLAGYSQGADVAYRVSSRLPKAARSRVIIAAFGDPHFNPAQSWADAGSYQPFYGILETGWNEPAHKWRGSYAPHLRSWCLHGDDICNATGLRATTCAVSCTRESGYINSGYTRDAALWAYRMWKKLS
jgi:pimeloyl-ACP methyl ester carboxylesterase